MSIPFVAQFTAYVSRYKARFIVGAIVVSGAVLFINDYLDTKAALRTQTAIASTNSELMRKLGDALVAQGNVLQSEKALREQMNATMGKQVADFMESQNNVARALYTAIGRIEATIQQGGDVHVNPGPDGSFQGVKLPQARPGPPLSQVELSYDPTAPDPTKRLASTWTNYREDFFPSLGEWIKKDGGYVAVFKLRREVWRPDPGGPVKIGEETINLENAKASYNPDAFKSSASESVPRWSIMGGLGRDLNLNKTVFVGIGGYRVNNSFSVHGGTVGNTALVGASWHFGLK